jgi:hypothetical protein
VGPDKESYLIPYTEVKRRDYFSNHHHGFMRADTEQGWTIELPGLERVSTEDFCHVADYLSTGTFGYRIINDDNRAEAMAQLIAAWEIGAQYVMHDLLKHIVPKLEQCMPWTSLEVLALVVIVYRVEGTLLKEIGRMKNLLTEFIADNYYEMVGDWEYRKIFLSRIRHIPELERDVHRKLANRAEESAQILLDPSADDSGLDDDSKPQDAE